MTSGGWSLTHLQRADKSTNNTVFGGEGLRKVEKARRERAQTANVIQAINVGMEVSLLYYISVLIVLEVVAWALIGSCIVVPSFNFIFFLCSHIMSSAWAHTCSNRNSYCVDKWSVSDDQMGGKTMLRSRWMLIWEGRRYWLFRCKQYYRQMIHTESYVMVIGWISVRDFRFHLLWFVMRLCDWREGWVDVWTCGWQQSSTARHI